MVGRLTVLLAALVAALAAAAAANASQGKERIVVEAFTDSYGFTVDCGEVGDYDFEFDVEGTTRVRVTDVVARDGTVLRTVLHIVFRETGTNTTSGESLPLRGAVHEVWDYTSGTRTLSGIVFLGNEPGGGTYVQDTGRITMTLDTREASVVAGPHEAFFGGGIDPLVCAALAGA